MLYAGFTKLTNLEASVLSVRAYQIFPYEIAKIIGYGLPVIEMMLGALLVIGLFTRTVASIIGVLLIAFIGGIISAWARGLSIDCGCFSPGGVTEDPKYLQEILRDLGFILLLVPSLIHPGPWSVDRFLFPPIPEVSPILDETFTTLDNPVDIVE